MKVGCSILKKVGIIGGLGPLAGAHFYRRLVELTPAISDEDHLPVILLSEPTIPSRIKHLNGEGESPIGKLQEIAQELVRMGADFIVIPSSTTNLFLKEVSDAVNVPVISLVREVTRAIAESGSRRIGLLGTTPTLTFGLYDLAFAKAGISLVKPDDASQEEVMEIIAMVKGGQGTGRMGPAERILEIAKRPWAKDMDGLLLACTEIPVIFPINRWNKELHLFSSTDILAKATIRAAYDKNEDSDNLRNM